MLLSDILATTSYSQSRGLSTLLQALTGRGSGTLLLGLGSLHRSCVWENGLLKAELTLGNPESQAMPFNVMSLAALPLTPATATASPAEPAAETNGSSQPAASTTPAVSSPSKINEVKDANLKALKHIAGQLPNGLAPFFQCKYLSHCNITSYLTPFNSIGSSLPHSPQSGSCPEAEDIRRSQRRLRRRRQASVSAQYWYVHVYS